MCNQPAGAVRVQLDGGGAVLISVVGEFDSALHGSFMDAVALGVGDVFVDLAETTFLDSSGLRALVTGRQETIGRGAQLVITRVSRVARVSLEITGLDELIGQRPEPDPFVGPPLDGIDGSALAGTP